MQTQSTHRAGGAGIDPLVHAGTDTMKNPLRPRHLHPLGDRAAESALRARPLAALLADAYGRLTVASRARVLVRLLTSVGSLALAVIGGGAFAKYIAPLARGGEIDVSTEDAARTTTSQVYELARYVEQSDPGRFHALVHDIGRMLGTAGVPASLA